MQLSINKIELRELKLSNTSQKFRFTYILLNHNYNEISTANNDYFLTGKENIEGSLLGTGITSPIPNNNQLNFESVTGSLYKTNSLGYGIKLNNTSIGGLTTTRRSNVFCFLLGTLDGYYKWIFDSFQISDEQWTFTEATTSKFGYFVGVPGSNFEETLIYHQQTWFTRENAVFYDESSLPDNDPYVSGGGSSGGGGGTGDFDGTSDTIGLPSLPSLSGLNTGFFTAFVPSASQMQSVSNYLWNNALTDILDPNTGLGEKVDALKKIVANPYDAIMGCSIIPVTPPTAGSKELKMYGILETGISLPYASTRWVQVDCGTLNIHEFWGSYLDYSPYTKTTSLYLPYIGTVSIDIDLIMARSLQVVYYVDILSGICVAFILVDGSVKFHYQGQCSTQVPITNADYSSVISAGIGLIGNASQVVGSAVTGGAGGGIGGAVAGAVSGAISQAPAIASNVMSAKPDIRSGGAIGSSAGILSVQRPYLIIERPKQSVPAFQNHFTGYPSNITAKVGDLTGYTEFETINLDGIPLTDAEKAELETLLKGGVYL